MKRSPTRESGRAQGRFLRDYFGIFVGSILLMLANFGVAEEPFSSLKDPEVLYLEGIDEALLAVTLKSGATVFTDRDLARHLTELPEGTSAQVIGWHKSGWLIGAEFRNNRVEGWVSSDRLSLPADLLTKAREAVKRKKEVESAIQAKEVLPGMSFEEVKKTLGKPTRTSFRHDAKGKFDIWAYIRYEHVAQVSWFQDQLGSWVQGTRSVKIPVGELKVEFVDGKVTAVEETKEVRR